MTSNINPGNIQKNYPIAGVDNNSQGFRDNFNNISVNFAAAAAEIVDLQLSAILKPSFSGGAINNDMGQSVISNARTLNFTETFNDLGTVTTSPIKLDFNLGDVQKITTGNAVILSSFTNTPSLPGYATLRVWFNITSTFHTITLPSSVIHGNQGIIGLSGLVFTAPVIGDYIFDFSTNDGGTTYSIAQIIGPQSANQSASLTALQSQVTTVNADLMSTDSNVAILQSNVTTLNGEMSLTTGEISTLTSEVNNVIAESNNFVSQISVLNGNITTINGEISTIDSTLIVLQNSIVILNNNVSAQSGQISSLQTGQTITTSQISAINGNITTIDANIAAIKSTLVNAVLTTSTNNMHGTVIGAASGSVAGLGTLSGNVLIDATAADYQSIVASGNVTLSFVWPSFGNTYSKVRVMAVIPSAVSITLPIEITGNTGLSMISNIAGIQSISGQTLTSLAPGNNNFLFEFSKDCSDVTGKVFIQELIHP